ncbi:hypothetical protein F4604DRAFT_1672753 [Suillus subluteus]|nr:hypothetical protein F4604DRAFT_1672753 [Suillus subluteus]
MPSNHLAMLLLDRNEVIPAEMCISARYQIIKIPRSRVTLGSLYLPTLFQSQGMSSQHQKSTTSSRPVTISQFTNTLLNVCKNLGAMYPCVSATSIYCRDPELVLTVLPTSSTDIYHAIKLVTMLSMLPTQENKIKRANDQYCMNLGMKTDSKFRGVISLPRSAVLVKPMSALFMIMGSDVGHPAPHMVNQPSVASLVYSFDRHAARYKAIMSIRTPIKKKSTTYTNW